MRLRNKMLALLIVLVYALAVTSCKNRSQKAHQLKKKPTTIERSCADPDNHLEMDNNMCISYVRIEVDGKADITYTLNINEVPVPECYTYHSTHILNSSSSVEEYLLWKYNKESPTPFKFN